MFYKHVSSVRDRIVSSFPGIVADPGPQGKAFFSILCLLLMAAKLFLESADLGLEWSYIIPGEESNSGFLYSLSLRCSTSSLVLYHLVFSFSRTVHYPQGSLIAESFLLLFH